MLNIRVLCLLIGCFICLIKVKAQSNEMNITVTLIEGEKWWGGAINDGSQMPYKDGFSFDLYGNNKGNQIQPLLLSNMGRILWSEEPFKFTFTSTTIEIESRGEVVQNTAGSTLKEAYQYASKNFFPADGRMPEELLFSSPQYNTWIELMYDQNQEDILKYANAIIDNGFPPGVLMIDDNWQEDYGKWNFHPGRFPDPKAMMDELHTLGFKVMLWVCPFVSPDSDVYRELARNKLFIRNPIETKSFGAPWIDGGQPAMIYWWNGVSAVLDLSNPEAVTWFKEELQSLMDEYGVDGYKLDAGDTYFYPEGLMSYKDGLTPNEHTELFARIGLDFPLNEYRATWKMAGRPLVQRLSDKGHRWGDLKTLIPNTIAQGVMGYAFTCPDLIGGGEFSSFLNTETIDQDLIVRSAQTHALMPMMQFSVAPWRILDEEHLNAVKKAVALREEFVPKILKLARESAQTGEPVVRSLEYAYPNQGFAKIKDQFMLGDEVLVAPAMNMSSTRKVTLPKGRWIDHTGKKIRGGREIEVNTPLDVLPYFVKQS